MNSKEKKQLIEAIELFRGAGAVEMPLISMQFGVMLPGSMANMILNGEDLKSAKAAVKSYNGAVILLAPRFDVEISDRKYGNPTFFYTVGCAGQIVAIEQNKHTPELASVTIQAQRRVKVIKLINKKKCVLASVEEFEDIWPNSETEMEETNLKASCLVDLIKDAIMDNSVPNMSQAEMFKNMSMLKAMSLDKIADAASPFYHVTAEDAQALLETQSIRERIEKTLYLFKKSKYAEETKHRIIAKVTSKVEKHNRIAMLNEAIKEIKSELGKDLDSTESDIEAIETKLAELKSGMNQEAEQKINEELGKLRSTPSMSPDYTIIKNYLSWLTDLPWVNTSVDTLDVAHAKKILDRDHHGLKDVKKRILEFIGVSKLKGRVDGSIICLIGPPGVGKTSLGRSIAEALNRRFFRFSLGGMRDEAEIKGHRRTYIGAQPGKLISAIKTCGTKNPVIMLDEIDKLAPASNHGDPSSALLEVLDPEQNFSFRDHFLDVPFDLSKVLFIATANSRDTIPLPLLDRMEIINLPGYITDEKLDIAKKHLIPKLLPKNGLQKKNIGFSDAVLRTIILDYARDAGVRSLENAISTCMRCVAVKIADGTEDGNTKIQVRQSDLDAFLGKKLYHDDPLMASPRPGVAMGLAWTAMGGTTLYIEVLPIDGEPSLKITGQLGDVMKESAQIAISLVEKNSKLYGISDDFFKKNKLHIHVPAGATPKDGPSAGITLTSAIISCATGKTLPPFWAMTGEITLTSRVLPVGGIKEKMIAAHRAGVKNVILPKENERDYEDVPEKVRNEMKAHFASEYSEVYSLLFS